MAKIDVAEVPPVIGTRYPSPFDEPCRRRENKRLGAAVGLTQFGVNLTRLPPNTWSSQRHWHEREDEFVYVLEGEVWLVTDEGEELLKPGDCAGFRAGVHDGHHLQNRSARDALVLTIGTCDDSDCGEYSDIDMLFKAGRYSGRGGFARKDGTPY
jgi:uncharacterized cupin superfamily protein